MMQGGNNNKNSCIRYELGIMIVVKYEKKLVVTIWFGWFSFGRSGGITAGDGPSRTDCYK